MDIVSSSTESNTELRQRNDDEESGEETAQTIRFCARMKYFLICHWRGLIIILTPIIFLFILIGNGSTEKYQWCAYTLILMAVFWVTECLPLPITALLPICIFPLTGVMDTWTTCACYMNDTVLMFLASMILAYSIEQSGLHRRLALFSVRLIGYSHYKLLFAICLVTTFISMWITNTAATVMVVPIAFALLNVFEGQGLLKIYETNSAGEVIASDMATCYFCAITFSATIGGIGTLVGTATNLAFKGLFMEAYPAAPEYLSFPLFSAFSIPNMIVMEAFLYLYLVILYFGFLRPKSQEAKDSHLNEDAILLAKNEVDSEWKKLGKITFWEIMVIILFSGVIILFFCRSPQIFKGWGDALQDYFKGPKKMVKDSSAAFLISFLMLLLPATLEFFNHCSQNQEKIPEAPIRAILDWKIMNNIFPYSFALLLGAGFALSTAAKPEYTDLNSKIGKTLKSLKDLPNYLIIFILIVITIFITNFAANVAVCNVVTPISMQLAKEIDQNPLWYNIATGLSASYCFCLPVGTPGNLVVQSAASIPTMKMIIAGIGPTISTVILTWVSVTFWAPVVWPDLLISPDWANVNETLLLK